MQRIKVVILCGGLGTRLREETEFRPKPMVKVGEHPILWHIMKIYSYYGFSDFILCLGYKGEIIKEYFYHYNFLNNDSTVELGVEKKITFHGDVDEKDWRITLADTGYKALKGARLKRIEKYVKGDTLMVTYGDGVADIPVRELLRFHHGHGRIATVTGVRPTARFGELRIKGDNVESFVEKPNDSGLANGGFFVFNQRIFDYLHDDDGCDFEYGPLEDLAREGQLMVYKHEGFWSCMDNIRDMDYLNNLWARREARWKVW